MDSWSYNQNDEGTADKNNAPVIQPFRKDRTVQT